MSEPLSNPFDPFFEKIREIVREEIKATANGNGHGKLLTAEELAEKLQVHKATVYEWVKAKTVPFYVIGVRRSVSTAKVKGETTQEKHRWFDPKTV